MAGLSRLFFVGSLSDPTERLTVLHNISHRAGQELSQLRQLAKDLDETVVAPELTDIAHYRRMTLEAGIKSAQAVYEHLNELIAQAENGRD